MNKLYFHHNIFRDNFFAFIGMCLCLYFCFHIVQGERGVLRLVSLQQQIEVLSAQNERLSVQRAETERKVSMMRPGSVDRDLLEERVRLQLGYKYADEYAVLD